jgi:protein gp37
MNRTSIEFADFTWNPITGCRNGCNYCWAEKFSNRYKMQLDFHVPEFHEKRMNEKVPLRLRSATGGVATGRNYIAAAISPDRPVVFTVDMGDIFSNGTHRPWRERVFRYVYDHPEVVFLFLTKKPIEYGRHWLSIPKGNTILGTSLDFAHNKKRVEELQLTMATLGYRTFVNIEPLMSMMDAVDFYGIEFVTVGALTGKRYWPDARWHRSIKHDRIYYKQNYLKYFPDLQQPE